MTEEDGPSMTPRTAAGRNFLVEVGAAAYTGGGFTVIRTAEVILAIEAEAALAAESRVAALEAAVKALRSHTPGGYEWEWTCTDEYVWDHSPQYCPDPYESHYDLIDRAQVLALLAGDKAEAPR